MGDYHIMLMFLSEVHVYNGSISVASYDYGITDTKTTNESAVRYVLQNGYDIKKLFVFETKTVQKTINDYTKENITHADFFRKSMRKYLPNILDNDFYMSAPFDENGNINKTLEDVTRMAKLINDNVDIKKNNVILHVDITGGMRYANIAILAVMRLMEYTGINIGKIVYSNYNRNGVGSISEINSLYGLFNLASGAEEFVNFGSVNAIESYFEVVKRDNSIELDEEMNKLLLAMKNFSRSIRLCMPDKVPENVENLIIAINDFKSYDNKGTHEKVFEQLIKRIEQEYDEFIGIEKDDIIINIIKWCKRKELWQQAMTLGCELLPLYICDKKIILPTDENVRNNKGDKLHPHWEQGFIINCQVGKGVPFKSSPVRDKISDYASMYCLFMSEKENYVKAYSDESDIQYPLVCKLLDDIKDTNFIISNIKLEVKNTFKMTTKNDNLSIDIYRMHPCNVLNEHREYAKLLRFLYYINNNSNKSFIGFISELNMNVLVKMIDDVDVSSCIFKNEIWKVVNILKSYTATKKIKHEKSEEEKWIEKENFWRCCLSDCNSRVYSEINNTDKIIAVLRNYNDLRIMRNRYNHANGTGKDSSELEADVKMVLERCIESLNKALNK